MRTVDPLAPSIIDDVIFKNRRLYVQWQIATFGKAEALASLAKEIKDLQRIYTEFKS